MVDQRGAGGGGAIRMVDPPAVLPGAIADDLGQHGIVFDQQQIHGACHWKRMENRNGELEWRVAGTRGCQRDIKR